VERRATILHLMINVTARLKKLFRDDLMPFSGRYVERR
jgi:hypothetical protein